MAQLVKNPPQCRRPKFNSWVGKVCWRRDRLPIPVFFGFPCDSAGKESTYNVGGNLGLFPGLGRSPGEGKGYPLQYSGLENSMDYTAKNWTWLSNFHFHDKNKLLILQAYLVKQNKIYDRILSKILCLLVFQPKTASWKKWCHVSLPPPVLI